MSGFKNIGCIIDGKTQRGVYDPKESKVNFAVPDVIVRSLSKKEDVESIKAGILNTILNRMSTNSSEVTYKICLDGKKINSSAAEGGEIDLWGFEKAPTLRDLKDKLDKEKRLISKTKEMV